MVRKISPKNAPQAVALPMRAAGPTAAEVEVADFDTALDLAGYGRLSYSVLCACAGAFFMTGVQNALSSYLLPAASCELHLSTYRVGLVNVAFMCGGVSSAFLWGIISDAVGLKRTLALTLLLDGALTLAQSSVGEFGELVAARAANGFLIGAPGTLVMTYLSDLVGPRRRQLFLNITGLSFTLAWLILPAVAWVVLPYKITAGGWLHLDSWRLYLAACSSPGLLSGLALLLLPESPRLLLDTGRGERALAVLASVYSVNTGRPAEDFPVKKLVPDVARSPEQGCKDQERSRTLLRDALTQMRCLLSKTYAVKSFLIAFIFFANMAAGFGLSMWIPELLVRMKSNSEAHQGTECGITAITPNIQDSHSPIEIFRGSIHNETYSKYSYEQIRVQLAENVQNSTVDQFLRDSFGKHDPRIQSCKADLDAEVYVSGLIVGACCVLGNVLCACVCSLGAQGVRRAAVACAAVCAAACAAVCACTCACAGSVAVAVAAVAVLNAAALNGNVLLMRLLLHALPPRLSALGVCWGAGWGRAGGVATNLAIGALLDVSCAAPFLSVAALLAVSVVCILLVGDAVAEQSKGERIVAEPPLGGTTKVELTLEKFMTTHL